MAHEIIQFVRLVYDKAKNKSHTKHKTPEITKSVSPI